MSDHPEIHDQKDRWGCRMAPCPVCGGSEFSWGTIPYAGGNTFVRPEDSAWKQLAGYERRHEITHRGCYGCGAILIFLKRPLPVPKQGT